MLHAMRTLSFSLPLAPFLVLLDILLAFSLFSNRADISSKVVRTKPSLILDVTCRNRSVNHWYSSSEKENFSVSLCQKKFKSCVFLCPSDFIIMVLSLLQRPPEFLKKGRWCHGGHPVLGERLLLSIPPEAMDRGLFGELSVLPVTFLSPCTLQYPNLATRLTHIQISF